MTTFLYARVSTAEQTLDHQLTQAREAGFAIDDDHVIADHGVSGVATRLCEREQGKRLFDLLRHGDTLVVRWVDRLGRRYDDVVETIQHFMKKGVIVRTVINGFTFDGSTKDPMQKAIRDSLINFMAAMAQAQAEGARDMQRAGIALAKASDQKAYRGRKPSFTRQQVEKVLALAGQGAMNTSQIAKEVGLQRMAVTRIILNPANAKQQLATWAM
ncbi:recombinase family protein [Bradyrhizobium sp. SBR1B]|uniref:recombinase family protein n=1 Tax=Bradyrhizobium sp. SBR1B TaxID=2663836 RepID=UPI001605E4CC|nr:recombinase family protein [Bradyrhizobium sp. SBR1B]MBB4376482.1 DNA invertase Pin-like site-specific DNA recombinase [Bradyrhizobium sp. SBR1B]